MWCIKKSCSTFSWHFIANSYWKNESGANQNRSNCNDFTNHSPYRSILNYGFATKPVHSITLKPQLNCWKKIRNFFYIYNLNVSSLFVILFSTIELIWKHSESKSEMKYKNANIVLFFKKKMLCKVHPKNNNSFSQNSFNFSETFSIEKKEKSSSSNSVYTTFSCWRKINLHYIL